MTVPDRVELVSWAWPEVDTDTDLATCFDPVDLVDGDVVVLTSKVVSKAEGRTSTDDRETVVQRDTDRVVARRGTTTIAQTSHGFVLAAAGVDASNVASGTVLSLPADPDASAVRLRTGLLRRRGVNVAVVVSDTAGRAWRTGQTDVAIGCAGLEPVSDLSGSTDTHGNLLVVTAPAVADEIAGAADLVKGKSTGRPVAVLSGYGHAVLPAGTHGPGAASMVREPGTDMFGLGARDAVVAVALRDHGAAAFLPARVADDGDPFAALAAPGPDVELAVRPATDPAGWWSWVTVRDDASPDAWLDAGRLLERIETLAIAHHLTAAEPVDGADTPATPGWRTVAEVLWLVA